MWNEVNNMYIQWIKIYLSSRLTCVYMHVYIYTHSNLIRLKTKKKSVHPNGYKYLKKEDKILRASIHSQQ